ncbi:MAG: hypothetical protein J5860_06515 [Clostridia bacterium]|nr:hypothetical protein [Clostridia bacterium]
MKKFLVPLLLFAVLLLSSCGGAQMSELLAFQGENYAATLTFSDGSVTTSVAVLKDGGAYTFTVDEKYSFLFDGEERSVSYNGLTVPISVDALKKSLPQKLFDALTSSPSDGWTIEDGGAVYICECPTRALSLHIGKETHAPVKIICGDTVFDVVRFDAPR